MEELNHQCGKEFDKDIKSIVSKLNSRISQTQAECERNNNLVNKIGRQIEA